MKEIDLLNKINNSLEEIELDENNLKPKPHVWVIGLPRSGTTLTMQLLSQHLNVGYVNNIMARFWKTPLLGAKLSQILLGENRSELYSSDYGSTSDLAGPHEFSYFWHNLFKIKDHKKVNFSKISKEIQWDKVFYVLNNVASLMPSPMIYKAMWPGYFLNNFFKMFPNSLYLVVERPILEVAASLTVAREKYYGNRQEWWSMTFDGYEKTLNFSYSDQIAIQLRKLSQIYFKPLKNLSKENVMFVKYEDICKSPYEFINSVKLKINSITKVDLKVIGSPPEYFKCKDNKNIDDQTTKELENSLQVHFWK